MKSVFYTPFYRSFHQKPEFPDYPDTVFTVFKPENSRSDTGFGFRVKIYPEIRTLYGFLSLFSGDTATSENFEISKSRGLVILTTGHYKDAQD